MKIGFRRKDYDEGVAGCIVMLLIASFVVGVVFLITLWTDRSIDYWLTFTKGTDTDCPFWLSFVATIFLNGIIVAFNLLTEIARLAL